MKRIATVEKTRVLVVHNRYRHPGGEDLSTLAEIELLRANGHVVETFEDDNSGITTANSPLVAVSSIWNPFAAAAIGKVCERFRPDIVHFHNIFPLISPACYYRVRRLRIPVVQTLHNYRLVCSNGLLLRDGANCEKCIRSRTKAWGVVHACYRKSRLASAAVAAMLAAHRAAGTWNNAVTAYIVLTDFAKSKFIEGGLDPSRIHVKSNCVFPDPGAGHDAGDHALFVGRLSPEKGLDDLVSLWRRLPGRYPLKIVGQGPMENQLRADVASMPWVKLSGQLDSGVVLQMMKRAAFLVFPSVGFEGMPRSVLEALATGLPVVANRTGGVAAVVRHGEAGLLCPPGSGADWLAAVSALIDSPELRKRLGRGARNTYLESYTGEQNYLQLMAIYEKAMALERGRRSVRALSRRSPAVADPS